ncbi:MAG: recombinase family protein [Oligoflexales bacterium]
MEQKKIQDIAVYYRVSTDRQDIESQKTAVEQWLQDLKEPPSSVQSYIDEGISGKTQNRPEFQSMLADAEEKKFDTIVVYRLDRFTRDANAAIRLILDLDQKGIAFISVTQPVLNLGHANPFRRTMLAAFAEIAEIERETIVTRVKAGLTAAKQRGVILGAPRKIDDEMHMKMHDLRLQGWSYRKIADFCDVSLGSVAKIMKTFSKGKEDGL